ncbi:MAG: hypothetical protein JWP34_1612 [Massilia sp.]|jgi:hypothetical protein|nr:hypothetical protein [Massilia sp.]MDB5907498.1 hypothetical protein [Massilia sp.]
MELSLQELEAAINFWRDRRPARGNEYALSAEVNVLARVYALMIFNRERSVDLDTLDASARQLLQTWRDMHAPT